MAFCSCVCFGGCSNSDVNILTSGLLSDVDRLSIQRSVRHSAHRMVRRFTVEAHAPSVSRWSLFFTTACMCKADGLSIIGSSRACLAAMCSVVITAACSILHRSSLIACRSSPLSPSSVTLSPRCCPNFEKNFSKFLLKASTIPAWYFRILNISGDSSQCDCMFVAMLEARLAAS